MGDHQIEAKGRGFNSRQLHDGSHLQRENGFLAVAIGVPAFVYIYICMHASKIIHHANAPVVNVRVKWWMMETHRHGIKSIE